MAQLPLTVTYRRWGPPACDGGIALYSGRRCVLQMRGHPGPQDTIPKVMSRRRVILWITALVASVIVAASIYLRSRLPYDPEFDIRVPDPAYLANGPIVLFDEGHLNTHTASAGYKPFTGLVRNDGYDVRVTRQSLSAPVLAHVSVLVVVLPRGANDANDDSAFAASEIDAVHTWVQNGGSLLLITDHWPYGPAASSLGQSFGIQMGRGMVEDPEQHDQARGASHLVFSAENGLLRDHAIVRGRKPAERIHRVLTFTGQSILGPPGATSFLALSDAAIERPPTAPRVERSGGDVRVSMEYGDPISARGRAQGVALEVGKGRIVVLGEAGMLRAERGRGDERTGMNVPGYDNRQLALNIMHWLTRVL